MNFKRLPAALAIASAIAVAACVPQAEEDTAPVSTPTPTPTPAPAPPQVITPTYDNWMDAPVTPGAWRYAAIDGGTAAFFGQGTSGGALFAMQCRLADRSVILVRDGAASAPVMMRLRTETQDRMLTARPGGTGSSFVATSLAASDNLLDAMAYSRGRFAVEVEGMAPLYVPAWPEVTRIIEDCR
ncbi:hypothetical protein [Paraurantiacibacter namhicola]|uniref:Lipoprotein n=1 Tax=Paraurantiacibacter namhicola TaxID=645517 RepID=A0A1C7D819_9SPHN|nr:hypothetical protein [Paraurantiacibacter namhicola]ANU07585.1 hypothetical protein A6F65_01279 [Paraurantiacibacter namhicola]